MIHIPLINKTITAKPSKDKSLQQLIPNIVAMADTPEWKQALAELQEQALKKALKKAIPNKRKSHNGKNQ